MSLLFSPYRFGKLEIRNRFVFSACEDNLGNRQGYVTDVVVRKYGRLAAGEVGLIISSHLFVHPWGRTRANQMGIHDDQTIPGLKRLVEAVRGEGGAIVFQLGHAGLSTKTDVIGRPPLGPSEISGAMDEATIRDVIEDFRRAAQRAVGAGADGVQIHAAHGYLLNEFLSPFYNNRQDAWGGSEENRFRLLKEVLVAVKGELPAGMIILVKLNAHDYTPQAGITPPLAVAYGRRLAELRIDGLEVSCGTSTLSPWQMCRGEVPVEEILQNIPAAKRGRAAETLNKMRNDFAMAEAYNHDKALMIKPVAGSVPVFSVGGWRQASAMEAAIEKGETDLISLCRPLIREPSLARKIRTGRTGAASCINCNRCLMALANDLPVRCYGRV